MNLNDRTKEFSGGKSCSSYLLLLSTVISPTLMPQNPVFYKMYHKQSRFCPQISESKSASIQTELIFQTIFKYYENKKMIKGKKL